MKKKLTLEIWRAVNNQFYWRALHRNGNIIADGSETYKRKAGVMKSLKNLAAAIAAGEFELTDRTK